MQKPHCRPWCSMKARCSGCRSSPSARPSTVRIALPAACTANIRQDRTGSPSTMHGAGAADAMLAADMGPGLSAIVADRVDQRAARLDPDRVVAAVDAQRDIDLLGHHPRPSWTARNAARMRCGVAGISSIATPNGAQRIVDRVDDRGRRADRAAFAQTLGAW